MCEGGLGAVARTKFVRRSDGRREVSHQSELTSECYLRQARMMEPSPSRLHGRESSYPIAIPDRRGAIRCYLSPG